MVSTNEAKYQTGNPVMRAVIDRFLKRIVEHVAAAEPKRLMDLGCGEGMVGQALESLAFGIEYQGLEINPDALRVARELLPHARLIEGDLLRETPQHNWAEVALCLEVLEHLEDPDAAVAQVARWTSDLAIFSVPWEPYFRMGNFVRGKYLPTLGNHPEHIQQFGPRSFKHLIEKHFRVVHLDTCFPWLIAVAASRRVA